MAKVLQDRQTLSVMLKQKLQTVLRAAPLMVLYAYLFFLSITMMSAGMKGSFKKPVAHYLQNNGDSFNELVSFVIGIVGTSLVQSSSTVTSMVVELVGDGTLTLLIGIGIVHGANLGTSVTSSLVAFFAETRPLKGNPFKWLWALMMEPRMPGFHRAVSTAVVHGLFNALMVTGILLMLELPFGIVHTVSEWTAEAICLGLQGNSGFCSVNEASAAIAAAVDDPSIMQAMQTHQPKSMFMTVWSYLSPSAYTKPVAKAILHYPEVLFGLKIPAWVLVPVGFLALFGALKGFTSTVKGAVLKDLDTSNLELLGQTLLGKSPIDTFFRGLLLTMLVQSSSATTSMVVPLAAVGLFSIRRIFPFILGANIGTTVTALIVAFSAAASPDFAPKATVALSHFYLNTFAVILVVAVPGLMTTVLAATEWLADMAVKRPIALLGYLATMAFVIPAVVVFTPFVVAWTFLASIVVAMLVAPYFYVRRKRGQQALAVSGPDPDCPEPVGSEVQESEAA
ncbi:MAG: sodium-dependent phosphate cotransporter [Kiritimatiellia bacterium]|jgi:sodium-dependent phosphate cotransporter